MAPSQCRQCGYCCSCMGEVVGIVKQLDQARFRIQFLITGVEQIVTIDPDKQDLFLNQTIPGKKSLSCPFLRKKEDGFVICTVYATRPELCRMYLCPKCRPVS
nr:YkgJ family cysteine cluster protein [uncultured Methanospirillum sp.]